MLLSPRRDCITNSEGVPQQKVDQLGVFAGGYGNYYPARVKTTGTKSSVNIRTNLVAGRGEESRPLLGTHRNRRTRTWEIKIPEILNVGLKTLNRWTGKAGENAKETSCEDKHIR